jgi:hypothetical protein
MIAKYHDANFPPWRSALSKLVTSLLGGRASPATFIGPSTDNAESGRNTRIGRFL